MTDPKIYPQSETDIARMIDRQNDFIEEFKIKEIPVCLEGLCEEME